MFTSFRSHGVVAGFWLISLASILFASLAVLGPLDLDSLGVGACRSDPGLAGRRRAERGRESRHGAMV